jgi:Flp pilus assembly protein TadD
MPVTTHGIAAAYETRPDGGGVQPTGARSWRTAPLWETLQAHGIRSAVVGWPGTACATDWSATVVDERYAQAVATLDADWPLAPHCVHPAALRAPLRDLRIHPEELDDAALCAAPAVPLAHAVSCHAAATWLIESEPWQFLAVHYGPLLAGGQAGAALLFDAMLARLLELAGAGTDLVVVGSEGMLAAAGPGFASDVLVHGARPADVAATVLARFGLRRDDAPGRILEGTAHDALRGVAAPPVKAYAVVPAGADADVHATVAQAERARLLELAGNALADGDFAAASALLEPALRERPDDPELAFLLGQCSFFLGDGQRALALGRTLVAAWPDRPWGPMMVGAALMQGGDAAAAGPYLDTAARLAGDDPQAALRLGAIALHLGRARDAERHYAVALRDASCAAAAHAGLGLARLAQGDTAGGEACLRASLGLQYHAPALHHQLGVLYASQGRREMAADALRTALAQRPGTVEVERLLMQVAGAAD